MFDLSFGFRGGELQPALISAKHELSKSGPKPSQTVHERDREDWEATPKGADQKETHENRMAERSVDRDSGEHGPARVDHALLVQSCHHYVDDGVEDQS